LQVVNGEAFHQAVNVSTQLSLALFCVVRLQTTATKGNTAGRGGESGELIRPDYLPVHFRVRKFPRHLRPVLCKPSVNDKVHFACRHSTASCVTEQPEKAVLMPEGRIKAGWLCVVFEDHLLGLVVPKNERESSKAERLCCSCLAHPFLI
jgi:hypothetical protein